MANSKASTHFDFPPHTGSLGQANQVFHHSYQALTQAMRKKLGGRDLPVIVMHGDTLVLYYDGKREAVTIFPQLYHNLKAVSHVPFAVYATSAMNGPGELDEHSRTTLKQQSELAHALLQSSISEVYFANCVDRSQKMLESTIEFISELLQSAQLGQSALDNYTRELASLLLDNAAEAAQLELDCLHKQVSEWQEQIGEQDWENLHVVICSGHQARYRETSKQYFQRLLREPESHAAEQEHRVIYAESSGDESNALYLLAVHLVDQQASISFFNCSTRLQQDILADATEAYLEHLLPND